MNNSEKHTVRTVNGDISCFLRDVAEYLFHSNQGDLSETIVIFPNRRARLFFNQYLSGLSDKPLWAPQYYTISDFIGKISGLQATDQLTLLFRLFKVYGEVTGSKEKFDDFYFYCETLLSDFDDLDKYRIDAKQLFKNLSNLKSLEDYHEYLSGEQEKLIRQFWYVFAKHKPSEEMKTFVSVWSVLDKIYVRYNELLDREGMAYEGKIYRRAIDILESQNEVFFRDKKIAFVGFNALNHSEEILFDQFRVAGNTEFFWDFDRSYINNEIHEAGFFLRKYLKKFPQPKDFASSKENTGGKAKISIVSVPSNIAQGKVVHHFLEQLQARELNRPTKAALILADEKLLLPVMNSLPPELAKVNISMGYPVLDTPVYSFLSSLADLHTNKRKDKNTGRYLYYHKDYFSVLNHPFLHDTKSSVEYNNFRDLILEKNISFLDAFYSKQNDVLYTEIFSWSGNTGTFGAYLHKIISIVIRKIIKSAKEDNETKWQLEILHAIQKVLIRFDALLGEEKIELLLPTVLNLLRRILSGISVPFSGEPLTGLQILGILETRTLDFENVIILSMNEGKFPKATHSPSMIPYSLREAFGLPTIRHQDAIYGYYFYRLLHRAKQVVLVYNTKTEGLQKGEPSRYILQLRYNSKYELNHTGYAYKIEPFPTRKIYAEKTSEVQEKLLEYKRPGGNSFLSPSALNVYLNCKLRFYFKYIEGMKEPENVEEEIESNVFGSIFHKAMEIVYAEFEGKLIQPGDIDKIRKDSQLIQKAIHSAFAQVFFRKEKLKEDEITGRNLLVKHVIGKYMKGILEYDFKSAPFRILSLEKRHKFIMDAIAIGGDIDRLDEKNEYFRVIDYKTGKTNSKFKNIDDLFDGKPSKRNNAVFQTFLYSWLLSREGQYGKIQPSLFFVRDIYKENFDHKIIQSENRNSKPVDEFSEYLEDFEMRLKALIRDLFDPSETFTQTEDTDYCSNCPYNLICSIKT